jgi:hypothetical protein
MARGRRRPVVVVVLALAAGASSWMLAAARGRPAAEAPPSRTPWPADPARAREFRDDALRRARVWSSSDPSKADFGVNPPDEAGLLSGPRVECRYQPRPLTGTTPKFDCTLASGEIVRVKYGRNPEIQAEVAATRLLTALGFGADRVYLVPQLRCFGCPRLPFQTQRAMALFGVTWITTLTPDTVFSDFEWTAVERRYGRPIEADDADGWSWFELAAGDGRQRAERDAFRLLASFLVHWDNKAANQRLVCVSEEPAASDRPCPEPVAIMQDLGATFGPRKVDLGNWRSVPVWNDPRACTVSMKRLPWGGGTFPDARISESGRRLLAGQLTALGSRQIATLFEAARFGDFERGRWLAPAEDVSAWVRAFEDKVRQIVEAGPCGSESDAQT